MNVNVYVIEDYENETTLSPKKTNPNKPNFKSAVRGQMSEAKSQIIYYLSSVLEFTPGAGFSVSLPGVLCFLMQPKLLNFHRKNSLTARGN